MPRIFEWDDPLLEYTLDADVQACGVMDNVDHAKWNAQQHPYNECLLSPCDIGEWNTIWIPQGITCGETALAFANQHVMWSIGIRKYGDHISQELKDQFTDNICQDPYLF